MTNDRLLAVCHSPLDFKLAHHHCIVKPIHQAPMFERIDPRSPTPIYAQIAERVRVAVAAGELAKGDSLPSVRALATRLRVNPATVVQAYRELEQENLLEMRQGAGTF